jgi:oligoribonuclease
MKYLSIDTETTGLDHKNCQILQIAVIIEDTNNPLPFDQIPKLNLILRHERISGSIKAIAMNVGLIQSIDDYSDFDESARKLLSSMMFDAKFIHPDQATELIESFLLSHGYRFGGSSKLIFNAAGKNFATFDKPFLEELPRWKDRFQVRNRVIDPAIMFVNWKEDNALPSLNECKERAGIIGEVSHNAIEDAWDVIQTLRKFYV